MKLIPRDVLKRNKNMVDRCLITILAKAQEFGKGAGPGKSEEFMGASPTELRSAFTTYTGYDYQEAELEEFSSFINSMIMKEIPLIKYTPDFTKIKYE